MENINPKAVYLIAITRRRKIWKERSCFGILSQHPSDPRLPPPAGGTILREGEENTKPSSTFNDFSSNQPSAGT
jgi:hypothetical protein